MTDAERMLWHHLRAPSAGWTEVSPPAAAGALCARLRALRRTPDHRGRWWPA
ncbi:hypothetical protein [Stutzerimonas nitrititolerans]|uniref:hypothetical protein n=1 Tax=Stutzerimonas nitrititolerans TaxID=2482751 RepID=UPI0028973028|nr:hypothetical protein [Stutzerimonas nitrititolerans]